MSDEAAELREQQASKARAERAAADEAVSEADAEVHDRRAEKAAMLAAKLAEREASERGA